MKKSMNLKVFVLLVLAQVLILSITSKVEAGDPVSNKKLGAFEKVTCSLTYEYLDANGKPKSIRLTC